MGLFNFVSNWFAPIERTLDSRMTETLKVGLAVARAEVHVISGHLQASIGGEYRQSDKTIILHADAKYALIEEVRGPTRHHSEHHYLAPAARAMGEVWGGNFELHLPHAALGVSGMSGVRAQEKKLYRKLSGSQGQTKIVSRRWHRRYPEGEAGIIL